MIKPVMGGGSMIPLTISVEIIFLHCLTLL